MEASDAADQIREVAEPGGADRSAAERFRTRSAIVIALLAMFLAMASLGGDNATKEAMSSNIRASDTWAFYQAKNIRQTANQIAAAELEAHLAIGGSQVTDSARQTVQQSIDRYRATVARYESEPDPLDPTNPLKGEGKKELLAQARDWEEKREHAVKQDPNFDYATALLQIAIVLGSVAIVASSRPILGLAITLGLVGVVLTINGFLLLFELQIG